MVWIAVISLTGFTVSFQRQPDGQFCLCGTHWLTCFMRPEDSNNRLPSALIPQGAVALWLPDRVTLICESAEGSALVFPALHQTNLAARFERVWHCYASQWSGPCRVFMRQSLRSMKCFDPTIHYPSEVLYEYTINPTDACC